MATKIEIVSAVATLIEPGKKYIIQVDKRSLSQYNAFELAKTLEEWDAKGIVVMYDQIPLKITEVN